MRRVWPYVVAINLAVALLFWHRFLHLGLMSIIWGVVIGATFAIGELNPLNINEEGDLTVGASVIIASAMYLGLEPTLIGILVGELIFGLVEKRPVVKTLFNFGQTALSLAAAEYILLLIGGQIRALTVHTLLLPVVFAFVNTLFVSWIISYVHRQRLWNTWLAMNRDTLAYSIILGVGGVAFGGMLLSYGWLGLVLVVVLVFCLQLVLSQASLSLRNIKERFLQTVRGLMTAIEYRDPYTYGHSSRVSMLSKKIAQEMGLSLTEVQEIELGGLVHDVGKVAIPEAIIAKPGALNAAEYEEIKAHTVIGERILLGMEGMERVASMARQHHLYHAKDKRSYPDQLPGEQSYIGSRILSVADAWDAMTSDRPYRKALDLEHSLNELKRNQGNQFDPEVVEAFLRVAAREGFDSLKQISSPKEAAAEGSSRR